MCRKIEGKPKRVSDVVCEGKEARYAPNLNSPLLKLNRICLLLFENTNLWMRLFLNTQGRFPKSSWTHLYKFAQFCKARVLAVGDAWISNKRSFGGYGMKYMC